MLVVCGDLPHQAQQDHGGRWYHRLCGSVRKSGAQVCKEIAHIAVCGSFKYQCIYIYIYFTYLKLVIGTNDVRAYKWRPLWKPPVFLMVWLQKIQDELVHLRWRSGVHPMIYQLSCHSKGWFSNNLTLPSICFFKKGKYTKPHSFQQHSWRTGSHLWHGTCFDLQTPHARNTLSLLVLLGLLGWWLSNF